MLKLEISYRVIILWRILVSLRGFFGVFKLGISCSVPFIWSCFYVDTPQYLCLGEQKLDQTSFSSSTLHDSVQLLLYARSSCWRCIKKMMKKIYFANHQQQPLHLIFLHYSNRSCWWNLFHFTWPRKPSCNLEQTWNKNPKKGSPIASIQALYIGFKVEKLKAVEKGA